MYRKIFVHDWEEMNGRWLAVCELDQVYSLAYLCYVSLLHVSALKVILGEVFFLFPVTSFQLLYNYCDVPSTVFTEPKTEKFEMNKNKQPLSY
jgi:hypothetical protein